MGLKEESLAPANVPECYPCHTDMLMNGFSMLLEACQCCSSHSPRYDVPLADKLHDCPELAHSHTVQHNTSHTGINIDD